LQETDKRASQALEVLLYSILEGYITEFVVDTAKSYNEAKRELFKRIRGRFLFSLQLSIKMLACREEILKMHLE